MIDHDQLFKQLLSTFFVEFLELFFPDVLAYLDTSSIEFLDKEVFTDIVSGEKFEADIVVKARFRGTGAFFLIHDENQGRRQKTFGKRMFFYSLFFHWKHDLPVYPIAVLSFDSPRTEQPDGYEIAFPDLTVLKFQYRVVQLNRLDWRDFMNRPNPVAAALMSKMRIDKADRPLVKLECLRLLVTLKIDRPRMKLISGFVDSYLDLNKDEQVVFRREAEELQPTIKEEVMELTTSWKEEGRVEGRAEGRVEEGLKLVLRLVERRFGKIPKVLRERISRLPLNRIEDLGEALFDFRDRSELETWLKNRSGKA